jgi:FlaA1/EpsC-like NDP-sugar epimerase
MYKKLIWFLVLMLQLNFYYAWLQLTDQELIINAYLFGSGISYGLLSILFLMKYNERNKKNNKIFPLISIFIACSIVSIGLLGLFSIIIPFQILNLIVLFVGMIYTFPFVFRKKQIKSD